MLQHRSFQLFCTSLESWPIFQTSSSNSITSFNWRILGAVFQIRHYHHIVAISGDYDIHCLCCLLRPLAGIQWTPKRVCFGGIGRRNKCLYKIVYITVYNLFIFSAMLIALLSNAKKTSAKIAYINCKFLKKYRNGGQWPLTLFQE